jgi:hypothetical protein
MPAFSLTSPLYVSDPDVRNARCFKIIVVTEKALGSTDQDRHQSRIFRGEKMADNLSKSYEYQSPKAPAPIVVADVDCKGWTELIGPAPVDPRASGVEAASEAPSHKRSSTAVAPPVDRDVELRELLQAYSPDKQLTYEAPNDYCKFVHFAPHALLHNSIAEVLRNESRQHLGMIAERLANSYLEVDRNRAFAKMIDSPGPPLAGFHRAMTPAEIGALVPQLVVQNPATVDRLAELIAGDPGRARKLGPELLAKILKVAASKIAIGRHTGSRAAA